MKQFFALLLLGFAGMLPAADYYEFDAQNPLPESIAATSGITRAETAKNYVVLCCDLARAAGENAVVLEFRGSSANAPDARLQLALRSDRNGGALALGGAPLNSDQWRKIILYLPQNAPRKVMALLFLSKSGSGKMQLEIRKCAAEKIVGIPLAGALDASRWQGFDAANPAPEHLTEKSGKLNIALAARNYAVLHQAFDKPEHAGLTLRLRLRRTTEEPGSVILAVRSSRNQPNSAGVSCSPDREFTDCLLPVPDLGAMEKPVVVLAFSKEGSQFAVEIESLTLLP